MICHGTGAVSYITKLLNWKQITTGTSLYFSESCCFLYHKVTKLKANHNQTNAPQLWECAVSYITKLLNWKQITTHSFAFRYFACCFLYHKVTKLKANHNCGTVVVFVFVAVSYITKLLNWKQITTGLQASIAKQCCFLYHKVTKLKANHNPAY